MTEVVAEPGVDESQDGATEAAPATQPVEDVATIKRRLAGKDQALTRTQAERDTLAQEAERLRQKVLEYEAANMTEAQRLQAERDAARAEAVAAKAEAQRERLARKFPLAFDALGESAPTDEDALSRLEERLSKTAGTETDDEPIVDPNNPRRNPPRAPVKRDLSTAKDALVAAGNPYFSEDAWSSTSGR